MPTVASVLADLKSKSREQIRQIYARHGNAPDRTYGVLSADMKIVAKSIRGQQALAYELFKTGKMEAMYIAAMAADGAQLTREQLNEWVEAAEDLPMVSEYAIPWLAVENSRGRTLALAWMKSKKEHVAAAGWCAYAGLLATQPDEALDFAEIEKLLATIEEKIGKAPNRVRSKMNQFVINVGAYVKPMLKQAKMTARRLGVVPVDVGDTECKVPVATEYIEKIEGMGRVGKKRKTLRC